MKYSKTAQTRPLPPTVQESELVQYTSRGADPKSSPYNTRSSPRPFDEGASVYGPFGAPKCHSITSKNVVCRLGRTTEVTQPFSSPWCVVDRPYLVLITRPRGRTAVVHLAPNAPGHTQSVLPVRLIETLSMWCDEVDCLLWAHTKSKLRRGRRTGTGLNTHHGERY